MGDRGRGLTMPEPAIAAIPSKQGLLAAVGFGGALVFDTSDRSYS